MEKLIYNLVKDRPWLKDGLKLAYQGAFSIFGRRRERLPGNWVVRDRCFFGFHDKSPWSSDGKWLLGHRFRGKGNEVDGNMNPVEIVAFDGEDWTTLSLLGTTQAWNWQQGSQLQWLGNSGHVIYNDFVGGVCKSVETDLGGKRVAVHPYPIAAVSPAGDVLAAICFESFGAGMPAYGYAFSTHGARSNVDSDVLILFTIDGEELARLPGSGLPRVEDEGGVAAESFISHIIFSARGRRVAFMRRCAVPGRRVRSTLFVYDLETRAISRAPFHNMVSHYCWLGDTKIFAFANTRNYGDAFYVWDLETDCVDSWAAVLGANDGHPHTQADGRWVLLDTYPDRFRLQHLKLWEVGTENNLELAAHYAPISFWGDERVDLHPRLRADGKYACIDCSTTGRRSLATFRVIQ
ncbi:MAG: hypothetical protein JJT88_17815 [Gammaproteobacteria bacterium]|nr:hypothetical protein [Gammaproteobacteria bacterium]